MRNESQTILIVDDEPLNLKMLKIHLASVRYRVLEATNGQEALRKAKEETDLILLDIMMPDMDGFETCRRLKEDRETRDIPIIFLSAVQDSKTKASCLEMGGLDYVSKPFDVQELLARVKTHLTIRQQEFQIRNYASKLEQMVEERTRQLIHADRLVTLGTFSAGIAHEVNNPNTFISGNVQTMKLFLDLAKPILERHAGEDETGRVGNFIGEFDGMLEGILNGSRRISQIVNSLKTYARQGGTQKRNCTLIGPVNDALGLLNHQLKHGVVVEVSILPELEIICDKQKISQVFVNLLNNALDAMEHNKGKITIKAEPIKNRLRIQVKDNGPGIPDKVAKRIFDPFFTTKEMGTGLGLSIVQGIIQEHQGRISLAPFDGTGAEFDIFLPLPKKQKENIKKYDDSSDNNAD